MAGVYIGIDAGGTFIRVGAFKSPAQPIPLREISFNVSGDYKTDIQQISCAIRQLSCELGGIKQIGIGSAGTIAPDGLSIQTAGNLNHWVGQPLVSTLKAEFSCRVVLANDAAAAALAEAHYGHGRGERFWFIIWGTGIGGCLVENFNRIPHVSAGEPGHHIINPLTSDRCACGQTGCLEIYCGGGSIGRRFHKDPRELCAREWDEVTSWFALGLSNIVTISPVVTVIFSGGIGGRRPDLLADIHEKMRSHMRVATVPQLLISKFQEAAGTVGALALLLP